MNSPATTEARQSNVLKTVVQTVIKICIAGGLIFWMIHKGLLDFGSLSALMTPTMVAFALACVLLQILLNNYRWLLLLRAQHFTATAGYTLPMSFIGMFFSFVMPGGVGGDVIKGYYLLQDFPKKKVSGAISIFMDRLIGFFVMIATATVAMFFNWNTVNQSRELQSVALAVVALFCAFIVFFALAFSRRLGRQVFDSAFGRLIFEKLPGGSKIRSIYDSVHAYRAHPKAILGTMLLSVLGQLPTIALFYGVALAMGMTDIPISGYFFIVPVGVVVLALPISPAGIGVGQTAFYFLFRFYMGRESQVGPTAVTVLQVTTFVWGLVGAFYYLRRKKPAALSVPNAS